MQTNTIIRLVTICAGLLALSCSHNGSQYVSSELDEYRTTCLKRGFAVDTDEHARCVVLLYAANRKRQAAVQEAVAAVKAEGTNANSNTNNREPSTYSSP